MLLGIKKLVYSTIRFDKAVRVFKHLRQYETF